MLRGAAFVRRLCTSLWVNNKTKVNREDEENEEVVICDENRSSEEGHEEGEDGEDVEEATKTPPQRTLRTRTRRKRIGGILESFKIVATRPELLSLGTTNSLYEAALHVFVFIWTPALEREKMPIKPSPGLSPIACLFALHDVQNARINDVFNPVFRAKETPSHERKWLWR